jgi:hypothetical protein
VSSGLLDDALIPEQEFRQFLSRHPEIMEDVEKEKIISHAFDMPYGAGYSLTGNRIYIDRHIPLIWPMKREGYSRDDHMSQVKVHIVKYPERHEAFESACIRLLAMDYETAHHHAVRAEWTLVTSDGFDWPFYESQWKPLIKADEVEKIERVPPDLDLTPYEGTKLHSILSDRMKSTKRTARGKFLSKV